MKFRVTRASDYWGNNNVQCEEAKEINGYFYIEINTIEQLIDFIKKYGEIVMWEDQIEIYDMWRE